MLVESLVGKLYVVGFLVNHLSLSPSQSYPWSLFLYYISLIHYLFSDTIEQESILWFQRWIRELKLYLKLYNISTIIIGSFKNHD